MALPYLAHQELEAELAHERKRTKMLKAGSPGRSTAAPLPDAILRQPQAIMRWVNMEMTTMTLKVQYLTKLEEGTQIRAGWYVTTPFCPEVVFATEQEALAYGRTEELRQELIDRVRAMSFDELRALKVKMT